MRTTNGGRAKAGCMLRGRCVDSFSVSFRRAFFFRIGDEGERRMQQMGMLLPEALHSASPRFQRCCSLRERSRSCARCSHWWRRMVVCARARAAGLRAESVRDVVALEKAAEAAQTRPRDPRAARRCFGGSLALRLSLDSDLQRPASSAGVS
jgi:hypothetical protein